MSCAPCPTSATSPGVCAVKFRGDIVKHQERYFIRIFNKYYLKSWYVGTKKQLFHWQWDMGQWVIDFNYTLRFVLGTLPAGFFNILRSFKRNIQMDMMTYNCAVSVTFLKHKKSVLFVINRASSKISSKLIMLMHKNCKK